MPLLSIVVPVYNTEKYLAECLDSICAQTARDLEILCVDDGSTDSSPAILAEYAARDSRIRVITQENRGELGARNRGIREARGNWLGFVDSDDAVEADMFERLLSNAEQYQADISHCGLLFCYPDGREIPHYGTGVLRIRDHDTALTDLLNGEFVEPSMCNKIYRSELFRDVWLDIPIRNNGDLACNYDLFSRSERAVFEDFCGYRYRRHADSVSADERSVQVLSSILQVRRDILEKSTGSIRPAAYRMWLSTLVHTLNQLSFDSSPEAEAFRSECRTMLHAEKDRLACLSRKQQIAARLHIHAPALARLIYRIYGSWSIYRYEH